MTRILIADEYDVVRQGLMLRLGSQPNWKVVAEASDGKEAIEKAIETKPDVAVIAYELPIVNGLDITVRIREQRKHAVSTAGPALFKLPC